MSGVIVAVGPGVTQWKVGDAVYGQGVNRRGGYAQYVVSDVADLAAKPARFSFAQAAGIPVVASAALRALDYANPMPGQRVVIVGAAGGVGSAAVQLVKARGGKVIAVASSEHNAFLKKLGADDIVNYDKEKPADKIKDADVVINLVDDQAAQTISYVKRGGSLVLMAGSLSPEQCAAVAANPCGMPGFTAGPNNAEAFAEINKLAAAGKFSIKVEKIFPLAQAGQAQEFNRSGHAEGKIILATQTAALANKR
jgi:NADPH:quinone reductase-like Zn-dependent oxidoreductase